MNQTPRAERWKIVVSWTVIALVLGISLFEGIRLRRWVFGITEPARFVGDMNHGCYWGLVATGPEGYFNQYDKMALEEPEWKDSNWDPWLDYAPPRLLAMRQWAQWQRANAPPDPATPLTDAWQRAYSFTAPMLHFNTAMEIFAAACAFLLTRYWVLRGSAGELHGPAHGNWQGAAAALCIWFSADLIINSHGWPQWDVWLVPWYLLGCLLGSLDWWFAAGLAIGIGAMFKGQMLSVCPIFLIWPLVQGRWGGALRWACGMTFAMAAIASVWLITYLPPDRLAAARAVQAGLAVSAYPPTLFAIQRVFDWGAAVWIVEMLVLTAAVPYLARALQPPPARPGAKAYQKILHSRWMALGPAAIVLMATVYWPWLIKSNRPYGYVGLLCGAALAVAAIVTRGRNRLYVLAAVAGGGLLACMGLFHGSTGWWDCAFHFGTIHWPYMAIGPTNNVPALLQVRFGWPNEADATAFTLPAIAGHWPGFMAAGDWWPATDWDVSAKTLLGSIYAVALVLSGVGIGLQARRNDRRILVAMVTPWIMFFLIPAQIQERYLLYASAAAACCIGQSVGMALLGGVLTIASAIMELNRMLDWPNVDLDAMGQNLSSAFPKLLGPDSGHTLLRVFDAMHPDMAWGIGVIGLVFLYVSLTPSPGRNKRSAGAVKPIIAGDGPAA